MKIKAEQLDPTTWEIPISYKEGMLVPARIIATEKIYNDLDEGVFEQVTNVACLSGIQKYSYCMPDGHWGYGFPVGGVAAFDIDDGIISPGGIGFDINCGMRLIRTNLMVDEVRPKIKELVDQLFRDVPTGTGKKGEEISFSDLKKVSEQGAKWCIKNGYGWDEDLEMIESEGCIQGADFSNVSDRAKKRGKMQLGTLGSGNHYLEIQYIPDDGIFDARLARDLNIIPGQVFVMIHCGSRGFGHQIATDYLRTFDSAMKEYHIKVNDRDLACAPFSSPQGQNYFGAMNCAINYAYANRQVIMHKVRNAFVRIFSKSAQNLEMNLIYDVAHNTAKVEKHKVDGEEKELVVHRKGATRAFGPGNKELPELYQKIGQPVIIGGSMETGSYLLVGTKEAEEETFGSTAHGSGRTMSRTKAKKQVHGKDLEKRLEEKGIYVRSQSYAGLAEEAGFAYKDVDEVCRAVEEAGISKRVVKLKPIGNIKG